MANTAPKRTLGTAGAYGSAGSAAGTMIAGFVVEATHWDLSAAGVVYFGGVCSLILALAGIWLAPSKKAEAQEYVASLINTPVTLDDVSVQRVAEATAAAPAPVVTDPSPVAPVSEPTPEGEAETSFTPLPDEPTGSTVA